MAAYDWIKLEKALREDVRVQRMARALVERDTCHGVPLRNVTRARTTVIGGLAILWMHADTFAGDDDTLELTAAEIDELTGIEGFAELLPPDWLEILDSTRVKLPGFQEHNGPAAKGRALNAKSQHRHRSQSTVTDRKLPPSRAVTVQGDQIRSDKHRSDTKNGGNGGTHAPENALQYHATLPVASWQEWLDHRRAKKWPVDPRTLGKQLAFLARYDQATQREIIDTSIRSNWQGLFPPKGGPPPGQTEQRWRPGPED